MAGWANALSAGTSTQQVALSFLQSWEFQSIQFVGYYETLLHRLPSSDSTSGDQTFLFSLLLSNADVHSTRLVFESSAEFYTNG